MSTEFRPQAIKTTYYGVATVSTLLVAVLILFGLPNTAAAKIGSDSCQKDKLSDALSLQSVAASSANLAESALGVRPAYQSEETIISGEYVITDTRYYEEKVSRKKTTYGCIGERKEYDAQFNPASYKIIYWSDKHDRQLLSMIEYYDFNETDRPMVAVSLLLNKGSVQLTSRNAARIGDLLTWTEAKLIALVVPVAQAAKHAPNNPQFILSSYTDPSHLELIDLKTGYSFGVEVAPAESSAVLSPSDEGAALSNLSVPAKKGKRSDVVAETRNRTLYIYADFYANPLFGWGGSHISDWYTKEWRGTTFTTDKGKVLGSSAALTQTAEGISQTVTYWFNKHGKITAQE
ncbi:hypothetical protein COV04_03735 [Candidatus Uhrbacteria bacterium CG10_big_fil_rev_8_21_14_0_10_48_11]|uniref:Uncharacterized protein n=1 Tax=Candidatus Uhrbacteria bacterium CG10_big_fil_rev_8_21_14_0_10_48_11 TaxID=1975037 RepID=A0A2M8LE08_9BACT|nr:MAG: hypothetical protein COV04_03735 [Candidatus Uhrbacteria bacterium CG10_big_fil_rev_8_21_14_0_10_48_11]